MKRTLAGLLVFSCLFFSANFYLRLFEASYGSHPSVLGQMGRVQEASSDKKVSPVEFSIKKKHFKRYFQNKNRFYTLNFEKIIHAFNGICLPICFALLLCHFDLILVGLRSPPFKFCS